MSSAIPEQPPHIPLLKPLFPSSPVGTLSIEEAIQRFGLHGDSPSQAPEGGSANAGAIPRSHPRLLLNMVSTVDGRASIDGRSASIGNRADRELFHALRGAVDAVMVGAGTARVEHYRRMIRNEDRRRRRAELGLTEEPLACIVSRSLSLSASEVPLLAEEDARVVLLTGSEASLPEHGLRAQVHYIRARSEGELDLEAALAELYERFAVRTLLCEGGPRLNTQLLQAGLVDELLLSLGAKLSGGQESERRILIGPELEPPLELELLDALENESDLFLRYRVASSAV